MRLRAGDLARIIQSRIPGNLNLICRITNIDDDGYWVKLFVPVKNTAGETVFEGFADEHTVCKADLTTIEKIIYGI